MFGGGRDLDGSTTVFETVLKMQHPFFDKLTCTHLVGILAGLSKIWNWYQPGVREWSQMKSCRADCCSQLELKVALR